MPESPKSQKRGRKEILILDPARTIIMSVGGAEEAARLTGRHVSRVRRWTFPMERGGSDGIIPAKASRELMRKLLGTGTLGPIHDILAGAESLKREELRALSHMIDGATAQDLAKLMRCSVRDAKHVEAKLRAAPSINPDIWELIDKRRQEAAAKAAS